MYDDYDKLTKIEQLKLLKEIDKGYLQTTKQINARIKQILESRGKAQRDEIKSLTALITALWLLNKTNIIGTSKSIMDTTWKFFEYASVKAGNPLILPSEEIAKLIGRTVRKRTDLIKWDKIIRANTKRLDRQVSKIIQQGIKNGKTARQIQNDLEKTMNMNRNKAKSIARTETNYYKSEAKMQVGRRQEAHGNGIIKTWVYTFLSNEPREAHKAANGQKVIGIDSYFNVGGFQTKAAQHFGLASQDINCTCDMKVEFAQRVETSVAEFERYRR